MSIELMEETVPAGQAVPEPQWAIVELFGHGRIAGAISEQSFGGAAFVKIDVPEVVMRDRVWRNGEYVDDGEVTKIIPAHTRSLGAKAIYAINWCDKLAATAAAGQIRDEPIRPYSLKAAIDSMGSGARQELLDLDRGEG
ncbi:hypothetical protein [Methylibium sp.]|uniref:hypothetical protein n=1 Tax=Methylibium sp. TaxID=2067992 RepID=UPI003D0BEF28